MSRVLHVTIFNFRVERVCGLFFRSAVLPEEFTVLRVEGNSFARGVYSLFLPAEFTVLRVAGEVSWGFHGGISLVSRRGFMEVSWRFSEGIQERFHGGFSLGTNLFRGGV